MGEWETVVLNSDATPFATFHSHNQKILRTPHGILCSYLKSRNADFTHQTFRLVLWDGDSVRVLAENSGPSSAPCLEMDAEGSVYWIWQDQVTARLILWFFKDVLADPKVFSFPCVNWPGGKVTALAAGTRLYFFNRADLFEFDKGRLVRQAMLVERNVYPLQYPYLAVDPRGGLHVAWLTTLGGQVIYRGIHMLSLRGTQWTSPSGVATVIPVRSDDLATLVLPPEDAEPSTWLLSFAVGEHAHFLYRRCELPKSWKTRHEGTMCHLRVGEDGRHRHEYTEAVMPVADEGALTWSGSNLVFVGFGAENMSVLKKRESQADWTPLLWKRPHNMSCPYGVAVPRKSGGGLICMLTDRVSGWDVALGRAEVKLLLFRDPLADA